MTREQAAAAQLVDGLAVCGADLAGLLGADLAKIITARARDAAPRLVAQLADPDTAVQAATAQDILNVLWAHGDPDPDWWRTPLGLLIAPVWAAQQAPDAGWSHQRAADVLGVTRGTVAQLVTRGSIERMPDGSCSPTSVLARLVRLCGEAQG